MCDTGEGQPNLDESSDHQATEAQADAPEVSKPVELQQDDPRRARLRRAWLDEPYRDRFAEIRGAVTRLVGEHKDIPQLRFFTPHDASHCLAVEDLIYRLVPATRDGAGKLSAYERFLLLATAWLHDVGMIRGLWEPDTTLTDSPIRLRHHQRSQAFIRKSPARCGVDPEDADVIGLLARAHGEPIESVPETRTFRGKRVRLQLVAAYLCLADALHIDSSRAPADAYAICLAYDVPNSTKIHWLKSRFVSGIDIDVDGRRITAEFKDPTPEQAAQLEAMGVHAGGIRRIHDVVLRELQTNLGAVMTFLIKAGITWFLSVERRTTRLLLDPQVMLDLRLVINNPDFLANPSSSRLYELLLLMAADIMGVTARLGTPGAGATRYWARPGRGGDSEEKGQPRINQASARKRLKEALNEFKESVLRERDCHLALRRLVHDLETALEKADSEDAVRGRCVPPSAEREDQQTGISGEPGAKDSNPIVEAILFHYTRLHENRRRVRCWGRKYFERFLGEKLGREAKPPDAAFGEPQKALKQWNHPVTVVLYGYSELVVKALCGMRDAVLAWLLRGHVLLPEPAEREAASDSVDWLWRRLKLPYHSAKLEALASDHFRLFVCMGVPKSQTASGGRMAYHDGHQYAMALAQHGFTNVIVVPDATVANLLHRRRWDATTLEAPKKEDPKKGDCEPFVDLVMMGINGMTMRGFRHSGGHLQLAANVAALRFFYPPGPAGIFRRLPRLVLVTTSSKYGDDGAYASPGPAGQPGGCDPGAEAPHALEGQPSQGSPETPVCDPQAMGPHERPPEHLWTYADHCEHDLVDGFIIQLGFVEGERVRKRAFVEHDRTMKEDFARYGVRLYNPREDRIPASFLDDVIWEDGLFLGDDRQTGPKAPPPLRTDNDAGGRRGRVVSTKEADGRDGVLEDLGQVVERWARDSRAGDPPPASDAPPMPAGHDSPVTEPHDPEGPASPRTARRPKKPRQPSEP